MKILLITSEQKLANTLNTTLTAKGFRLEAIQGDIHAAEHIQLGVYDILILDEIARPNDLQALVKQLRSQNAILPVITLSNCADAETRVQALTAGADYCLSKPVHSSELIACINALLRRQAPPAAALRFGDTELDPNTSSLHCGEQTVRLSAREYDIMRALIQSGDRISSKEALLARVWGYNSNAVDNHVEVYIAFLRRKLEAIRADITIATQRRAGYYLSKK